jgi:hypothetical protein
MTAVKTVWGPAAIGRANIISTALATYALDDANDAIAWTFCVPRDGTITHVGFLATAITGTPPAYNCGLVTVDSSGRPTTTAYGGGTNGTVTPSATGWTWVALGANATAVAGNWAAAYLWPSGSAPDVSNNVAVARESLAGAGVGLNFTTTWNVENNGNLMAVKYNDNSVYGNALTSVTIGQVITSETTPDEMGCKFTLPANMTVNGIRLGTTGWGASAALEAIIYNEAGTALVTAALSDKDFVDDGVYFDIYFDPVNLAASTVYRVIIKPTVGTGGNVTMQRYQFESTAARESWPPGGSWELTYRTDAGAWTDVSTDLCYIGLHASDITFGTGGGSEYGYIG